MAAQYATRVRSDSLTCILNAYDALADAEQAHTSPRALRTAAQQPIAAFFAETGDSATVLQRAQRLMRRAITVMPSSIEAAYSVQNGIAAVLRGRIAGFDAFIEALCSDMAWHLTCPSLGAFVPAAIDANLGAPAPGVLHRRYSDYARLGVLWGFLHQDLPRAIVLRGVLTPKHQRTKVRLDENVHLSALRMALQDNLDDGEGARMMRTRPAPRGGTASASPRVHQAIARIAALQGGWDAWAAAECRVPTAACPGTEPVIADSRARLSTYVLRVIDATPDCDAAALTTLLHHPDVVDYIASLPHQRRSFARFCREAAMLALDDGMPAAALPTPVPGRF